MDAYLMSVERAAELARDRDERREEESIAVVDRFDMTPYFDAAEESLEEIEYEARCRAKAGPTRDADWMQLARDADYLWDALKTLRREWRDKSEEDAGA